MSDFPGVSCPKPRFVKMSKREFSMIVARTSFNSIDSGHLQKRTRIMIIIAVNNESIKLLLKSELPIAVSSPSPSK